MNDADMRRLFASFPPNARDVLRRAARADQWERDELASSLMREAKGQDMADLIDELSLHDDVRRQVVRVLGEMETEPR
jgi:hypothetical protein